MKFNNLLQLITEEAEWCCKYVPEEIPKGADPEKYNALNCFDKITMRGMYVTDKGQGMTKIDFKKQLYNNFLYLAEVSYTAPSHLKDSPATKAYKELHVRNVANGYMYGHEGDRYHTAVDVYYSIFGKHLFPFERYGVNISN